jgi:hypothetical protein
MLGDIKYVLMLEVNGSFLVGLNFLKHFVTFFDLIVVIHVFLMLVKAIHCAQVNSLDTDSFKFLGSFLLWFFGA